MTEQVPNQQEIDAFKPPRAKQGQSVVFYPSGVRNSRTPSLGVVFYDNGRIVSLMEVAADGRILIREGVRHIDDPKLRLNETQRENGAWDFSPADMELRARLDDIDAHLKAIEGCLLGPTKSDRELLYYYAAKFDIPAYSTRKSEELRTAVLRCLNGQTHGLDEAQSDKAA